MPHANFFPLFTFAIALTAVWWLARSQSTHIAMDRPNERSLHDTPVPRTGGLGLHLGVLLVCPLLTTGLPTITWIAFAGLLVVSFADDISGLPVAVRLTAHLLASGTFAYTVIFPAYGPVAACVITLGLAWLINLYNFMDGSDGLAGGMAMFGFGFFGIAALLAGSTGFALLNFSIFSAAVAFLLFNFHPARIFMGDVGAVPLGFLAGTTSTVGWLQDIWTWWFPLVVFSPFIVDASVTLARRTLSRKRVWDAHREHYYQKLVRIGWGHRRTALAEYALMALSGAAALAGLQLPQAEQDALLLAVAALYAVIIGMVEFAWRGYIAKNGHEA